MPVARSNIQVRLDSRLYERFRTHCQETCRTPTKVIAALVERYLDEQERQSELPLKRVASA